MAESSRRRTSTRGARSSVPTAEAYLTVPPAAGAVQTEEPAKPGPVQATRPRPAEIVDDEAEGDRPRRRPRDEEDERRPRRGRDDDDDRLGEPEATSGKAVAALILGLMSLCLSIFTGIPAIILGAMSLSQIKRSRGRLGGQGMAIAGIVLGAASLVLVTPALLIGLLVPAVQKVREAAAA